MLQEWVQCSEGGNQPPAHHTWQKCALEPTVGRVLVRLFGGEVRAGWQGGRTTDRSEGARTIARNSAFSDSEREGRGVPAGMTASV